MSCMVYLHGRNCRGKDSLRAADAIHGQQPFLGQAPVRVLQELALHKSRRRTGHGLTRIPSARIHNQDVQARFLLPCSVCNCFQAITNSCLRKTIQARRHPICALIQQWLSCPALSDTAVSQEVLAVHCTLLLQQQACRCRVAQFTAFSEQWLGLLTQQQ